MIWGKNISGRGVSKCKALKCVQGISRRPVWLEYISKARGAEGLERLTDAT